MNLKYRTACFYKLRLIASLLFVATAVTLLGSQTLENQDFIFRNPPCPIRGTAVGTDHTLSGDNAGNGRIPGLTSVDVSAASTAELEPAECNHKRQSDQEPSSPAQNSLANKQERGDAKLNTQAVLTSSAASNVQPADAANPNTKCVSNSNRLVIEKLSPAELWVRLLEEEHHFSIEPQILEGNKFR